MAKKKGSTSRNQNAERVLSLVVLRKKNGYVLEATVNPGQPEEMVYQDPYDDEDEVERFAMFLRVLCDEIGPSMSRHSPKRIYIIVKPGDKYVGERRAVKKI